MFSAVGTAFAFSIEHGKNPEQLKNSVQSPVPADTDGFEAKTKQIGIDNGGGP
jgi:hypothetical protein